MHAAFARKKAAAKIFGSLWFNPSLCKIRVVMVNAFERKTQWLVCLCCNVRVLCRRAELLACLRCPLGWHGSVLRLVGHGHRDPLLQPQGRLPYATMLQGSHQI